MITSMIIETSYLWSLETILSIINYKDTLLTHKVVGFTVRKSFMKRQIYTIAIEGMGMDSVWKSVLKYVEGKNYIKVYFNDFVTSDRY